MRIHVQNPAGETLFPITETQWRQALTRHPDMTGLTVSFADDDAGFAAGLGEADILLTWVSEVDRRLKGQLPPERAPGLKAIFCTSAGVDRLLPLDWLPARTALLNNRGTHGAKAGEYGIMALLMLANHIPTFAQAQQRGEWRPRFATLLAGRTVCVVGLGTLGGAVAGWAKRFGMTVIGVRSRATPHESCDEVVAQGDMDSVLPRADYLVLACPLTPETRGLMDRRRLALLPAGARLVNIGRGALWDQDALCDLLESGHLGGAVTDVATPEPLPPEHRLWRAPNLLVTPHMSSDNPDTYNDISLDILFENIRAHRAGQGWPNQVRPDRGY